MPLFLLIPLVLLVLTIALAPVLAVAVVPDRGAPAGRDHDRLPRYPAGPTARSTAPAGPTARSAAPAVVDTGRHLHRAA